MKIYGDPKVLGRARKRYRSIVRDPEMYPDTQFVSKLHLTAEIEPRDADRPPPNRTKPDPDPDRPKSGNPQKMKNHEKKTKFSIFPKLSENVPRTSPWGLVTSKRAQNRSAAPFWSSKARSDRPEVGWGGIPQNMKKSFF